MVYPVMLTNCSLSEEIILLNHIGNTHVQAHAHTHTHAHTHPYKQNNNKINKQIYLDLDR